MINVKSRSESEIAVDIYSQTKETENNYYYRYKSDEIEGVTGIPSSQLLSFVDDILRRFLMDQGVDTYDISINPDVIPTTVDYLVNDIPY